MANIIVGIFEQCAPSALESTLHTNGIDTSRLKVVMRDGRTEEHANSVLDFVFVTGDLNVNDTADEMTHGTGLLSDSGGTTVPGLNAPSPMLIGFGAKLSGNYFGDLPIPHDEVGNLNDAIEAGRCVAVYTLSPGENPETLKTAFQSAGFLNIRVY